MSAAPETAPSASDPPASAAPAWGRPRPAAGPAAPRFFFSASNADGNLGVRLTPLSDTLAKPCQTDPR